jgi:hypothetical protein
MKNLWIIGIALLAGVGCNAGNAPEPMNEDQLTDAVGKLKPQDQINYINSSPMPPAMKAEKIKAIEEKYGIKAEAPAQAK